jgi:hypothetical protein
LALELFEISLQQLIHQKLFYPYFSPRVVSSAKVKEIEDD